MKKIVKVFYVIERNIIKRIDGFSPRKYMKCYNRYLKKIGINLVGTPRYIHPSVIFDGKGYSKTYIGNNVVISRGVLLLVHDYSITCGLRAIGDTIEHEAYWLKHISIGENVFIGANSTILPGTEIGKNTIIGAGSVVKGKIPENSIVLGNPAAIVANTLEWAGIKKNNQDYCFECDYFE